MGHNAKSNEQYDGKGILDCVGRYQKPPKVTKCTLLKPEALSANREPGSSVAAGWLKAADRWVNFNEIPKRERPGALCLQR